MGNYNILKTKAPMSEEVRIVMEPLDKNQNDLNDTMFINELYCGRVDALITEDKQLLNKASLLGISDRVYTIDAFPGKGYRSKTRNWQTIRSAFSTKIPFRQS